MNVAIRKCANHYAATVTLEYEGNKSRSVHLWIGCGLAKESEKAVTGKLIVHMLSKTPYLNCIHYAEQAGA